MSGDRKYRGGIRWVVVGLFAVLFLGGCTLFRISVLPPAAPLKERVVEGEGRSKVVLIDVSGFLSEKKRRAGLREKPSLVSEVKEALKKAEEDKNVVGVLVRINTPGGTVTASDIIHHEIVSFRNRKKVPVHAAIVGVGASGGYYLATAADRITAHPTSITGSIGVIFLHFEVDGLLTKLGVAEWSAKSGDKKDMMSPFRPPTPEERKIVQGLIDGLYGRFLDVILARRGNTLTRPELVALADGRVYSADQALAGRLIDRICYLDEAVDDLKKAAGVKEARVVTYLRSGDYEGSIYTESSGGTAAMLGPFSLGEEGVEMVGDVGFAYLWKP